ncbi:hypothetical protein BRC85_10895 [Halobacteriales archaeon QS_1_69_70]|nr:MAG: hypothetical protein BRC85_10895 [Halobacteriales archaeon QS_1_69_70]
MTPTSRRRFVAAAGAALLSGCSGTDEPDRTATVTPVEVPRSAGDVLSAVESVPVPSVPPAPVVSAAHRRAVVGHVDERIRAAEAALAAADGVALADVESLEDSAAPFEACRSHLRDYGTEPTRQRFRRVARAFDDVAAVVGYARAASGDLDAEALRGAVDAARTGLSELDDALEYRLASPAVELLPTAAAGEAVLERAGETRQAARRAAAELAEPTPPEAADVWRSVESLRLETTNAAGYIGTAFDPTAPPRDGVISERTGRHIEALASLEAPRRPNGRAPPSRVRTVLSSVRSRRSAVLAAADPTDPETARRLELLLDAVRIRGQLEAFDAAAAATFARLDAEEDFPTERLVPEKRAAVDRVRALAEAAPLPRHLGRLAEDMVTYGDRLEPDRGTDPVATAHFMYVAAGAYVDRSLERGQRLAAALDPGAGG